MPSGEASDFVSCAVCARSILRGERVAEYVTPDGESVPVCSLCKPRAEASDWTPAALAGRAPSGPPRRGRAAGLRERIARFSEAASEMIARGGEQTPPADEAPPRRVGADSSPAAPAAERPSAPPPTPERAMRRALEDFNRSPEARTVMGLRRSLGEPHATARHSGSGEVLLTVAWELSWYQWRIGGGAVREVGKGKELSELAAADRDWNAAVDGDGAVRLARQARPERVRS